MRPRAIAGVLVAVACGGGKKDPPRRDAAPCELSLKGTIGDTAVASGCKVTITDDVVVAHGTLTLGAGVRVGFADGRSLTVGGSAAEAGKLVVAGSEAAPVVFGLAGDAKSWGQVHLGPGAGGSTLSGLTIEHAGKDGKSALLIEAADVSVTSSIVHEVAAVGVELAPGVGFGAFSKNKLEATGKEAVRLGPDAVASIGDGNVFGKDATIGVVPGTLARSVTWRNQGAPYLVGDLLKVEMADTRGTLTLEAGVEVRFGVKAGFAVGVGHPGGLHVAGTAQAPVTLTSADGKPGAWSLWVGRQGEVVVENAVVAEGGVDHDAGAIAVRGGSLEVYGTTFRDDVVGLTADDRATIAVDGCKFDNDSAFAMSLAAQLGALGAKNTYDAGGKIEVRGGTLDGDATWTPQAAVWFDGKVTVEKGTLTIAAGTELTMMSPRASLVVASGKKKATAALVIAGTPDQPVKLTGVHATPSTWGNVTLTGMQTSTIDNLALVGAGPPAAISAGDGVTLALHHVTCEQCAGAVVSRTCKAKLTLESVSAGTGTPTVGVEPQCPAGK